MLIDGCNEKIIPPSSLKQQSPFDRVSDLIYSLKSEGEEKKRQQIGKWTISLVHWAYNMQRDSADCNRAGRDDIRAFASYAEASDLLQYLY